MEVIEASAPDAFDPVRRRVLLPGKVFLPACQPQQIIELIVVRIAQKLRANNDSR